MNQSRSTDKKQTSCPSASASSVGAEIFGIVGGTPEEPRVEYLDNPVPLTPELLEKLGTARPGEVLRVRARCAESACAHYSGRHCTLGERIAVLPASDSTRLPACSIRSTCRWFDEQGKSACLRCPLIVTEVVAPAERLDKRIRLPILVDQPTSEREPGT